MNVNQELALLHNYLVVGAVLFGIGLIGFVSRRNMIVMFLAVELMLQGVSLSLVGWGRFYNSLGGQVLVILIIAVAACEAAVGLALVLMLFRHSGSLDTAAWQELREANQPPYRGQELPEEPPQARPAWPHLPPAGREPTIPREETDYRRHV